MSCVSAEELEQAICQLPAVFAARVLRESGNGNIEKIHVMATPGRHPKKVVRDIETLLLLKFDLRIDYRKISLVQLPPEDLSSFVRSRVKLKVVDRGERLDTCRVDVTLESESRTHKGMAEGPAGGDCLTLATQATLDALSAIIAEATIKLKVVEIVPIQNETAVFVFITAVVDGNEEKLLGSCFTHDDALTAAARATLDAVNRRFFSP